MSRQVSGAHAPKWLPLPPEHEKRLDQILGFWEYSTGQIQRYRSRFKRFEYEPNRTTYSEGVIKFATPDKGLFRVEKVQHTRRSDQPGEGEKWTEQKQGYREHWVCDGKSVWEFDHQQQQLIERALPPDVRGQRIIEGPLPFMFGAKADQIRQRFWIRPFWPEIAEGKQEYWLELIPKTREDVVDFKKLHIIIDESDYLPKGMILFHRNASKTTFVFESRETNWNIVAQQLNIFFREFYAPKAPRGWEKIVQPTSNVAPVSAPNRIREADSRRPKQIRPR